jgi:hypothetical protein
MAKTESIVEDIPFRFKISGNLIKKLGEESIANKNIAILELVKNSYDAGATIVDVNFNQLSSASASIILTDNGKGMTGTDLENKWLNIATPNKSTTPLVPGERIPVGEKGIGRLSSESLGSQTILVTRPKDEAFGYKIMFDWNKYLEKSALVNEVINQGHKFKKVKKEQGTILEITKLRHNWNDSDTQKSILKDFYLLHPPNEKPKNFRINTNLKNSILKKIDKKFLDRASYQLRISLEQGDLIKYEAKAINGKTKKDSFKLDRKLVCGDVLFDLYYFYRTALAVKNALGYEVSTTVVNENNSVLDEYYGIKIFRDSFRVKPYGEEGDDWLGLDLGYQNNTMFPRNNNVFGMVHLTKSLNPGIVDTTTREGIVYNNEFKDLQSFLKIAIQEVFLGFRNELEAHKKKASKKAKQSSSKKVVSVNKTTKVSNQTIVKLIDNLGGSYPQSFYSQLEQEINDTYINNYPNAAFFLSRKLIENLIFNILEKKYPTDIPLWYNTSTNSHHKLSQLITNLYNKRTDFKPNVQRYIDKFNIDVGTFRKEANSKAHNIFEYLSDRSDLKQFKINDLIQLLLNIYHNI